MSALPKAVQRQIAEANKIADDLNKLKVTPTPPPNPPEPVPPPPGTASVIVTPAGAPPPDEAWEKKYKVLKGKYDAEVPRLIQENRNNGDLIRTLQGQLVTLQGVVSQLNQRRDSAPVNPPSGAPAATRKLVTEAEVKAFGPDLYDFIQRTDREVAPQGGSQVPQPIAQQLAQVTQTVEGLGKKVELNDLQRFEEYLDQHAGDWREQNKNQEFFVWLDEVDAYTGRKRQELLDQAAANYDGPRVVALFKGFQNENAAVSPTPSPAPPAPAPAAAPPAATPTLERLVAPGLPKAGPAGAPNEAQKRIYTRAEIDAFVHRKNQYVIKGRKVPDALVAEERAILAAGNEGRISG
jgi:hypothetical protein